MKFIVFANMPESTTTAGTLRNKTKRRGRIRNEGKELGYKGNIIIQLDGEMNEEE
jgi:hypothetical protein